MHRLFAFALLSVCVGAHAQGSLLLVGGGSEAPGGYAWFVGQAANKRVVVLDYEDAPGGSIPRRLAEEGAAASYLPVSSREAANDPALRDSVLAADGVFLPGGNQWRYVAQWRGTLIEEALQTVFGRGGVLGGTSAGAMALSGIVFDAQRGSFSSREALLNPTTPYISLSDDFLDVLPGALVDTHFEERGRLGRLLAMLANYHAGTGTWVKGIGLDYATALAVGPEGTAEVFGGGTVALLYPTERASARVAPGEPLALSHVRLVQLTQGARVRVSTGEVVHLPGGAAPFVPLPFAPPPSTLLLDGSEAAEAWGREDGSIEALLGRLGPDALVCVVSRPGSPFAAAVASELEVEAQPTLTVALDAESRDDGDLADAAAACDAQVWVGNDLKDGAEHASPATAVGLALRNRLADGAPALFLGTDARLAGQASVLNTESRCDASYRGQLGIGTALGLAGGLTVMPLAFDGSSSCHWENQITGLFWGIAQSGSSFGALVAEGSTLEIAGGAAESGGRVPTLIVDARSVESVAYPARRNNAALAGALLHVVPPGSAFDFESAATDTEAPMGAPRRVPVVVYPNPTTGDLTLRFVAGASGRVNVTVYDLLGRAVLRRDLGHVAAGATSFRLDLSGLRAGTYAMRMRVGDALHHRTVTVTGR